MSIPRMEVVRHDAQQVKDYIRGRWAEELAANGIDPDFLSGNHCPCPKCGGTDRWRFTDLNGDGGAICNQCGKFGDGFAVLEWFTGKKFVEVLTTAADRLKISPITIGDLLRQINLYRSYSTFSKWAVVTNYPLTTADAECLKSEKILHLQLGSHFEAFRALQDQQDSSPGLEI